MYIVSVHVHIHVSYTIVHKTLINFRRHQDFFHFLVMMAAFMFSIIAVIEDRLKHKYCLIVGSDADESGSGGCVIIDVGEIWGICGGIICKGLCIGVVASSGDILYLLARHVPRFGSSESELSDTVNLDFGWLVRDIGK